jgi:hypothetical protein
VSKLEGEAAMKPNLDRWRRIDLGLGPISGRAIGKVTRDKKVGELKVTLVDMRGPGVQKAATRKMPPMHAARGMGGPLQYKTPEGWRDGGSNPIAKAIFTVTKRGKTASVRVTELEGAMPGGLLPNVNRWRDMIGLPPIKEADLNGAGIRDVRVANVGAKYIDLVGKDQRSLVAWLERDGKTWFFRMQGPREVVDAEKENFEAFLQSVSFR